MPPVDYVVVGAGYAGLMCGKKLIDEGRIILEGNPEEVCDEFITRSNAKFLSESKIN